MALCRLVVPAWLLMAAVVTLAEANPHTLPPMTILAGAVVLAVGHLARRAEGITVMVVSLVRVCEMVLGNTATSGFLGAQ